MHTTNHKELQGLFWTQIEKLLGCFLRIKTNFRGRGGGSVLIPNPLVC